MKRYLMTAFGIAALTMMVAMPFGPYVRTAVAAEGYGQAEAYVYEGIGRRLAESRGVPSRTRLVVTEFLVSDTDGYLAVDVRTKRHWVLRGDEDLGFRILADIGQAKRVKLGRMGRHGYRDLIVYPLDGSAPKRMVYVERTDDVIYRYVR